MIKDLFFSLRAKTFTNIKPVHYFLITVMTMSFLSTELLADDEDDADAYLQLNTAQTYDLSRDEFEYRLKPLDFNLVGDSHDISSGAIAFSMVDVSLPGNSSLEVAFRRKASESQASHNPRQQSKRNYQALADWNLDVPTLSTFRGGSGSNLGVLSDSGCFSDADILVEDTSPTQGYTVGDMSLSGGVVFNLPGSGSQQIMNTRLLSQWSGEIWAPIVDDDYQGASKQYTTLHCKGNHSVITTSDGTQYYVTKKVNLPATSVELAVVPPLSSYALIERYKEVHLVTQAKDVHGNTVNWDYDNAGRLTKIHSNDGRVIDISYNGNGRQVSSVNANGRIWQYTYSTVYYPRQTMDIQHWRPHQCAFLCKI